MRSRPCRRTSATPARPIRGRYSTGCPGHALWKRDFTGASGLFSFVLNGGSDAGRVAMIDGLKHFGIGYSWGGYESLALPIDPQNYRTAKTWEAERSEEHTSELQSLMRISYAVFCLKKKTTNK